MSEKVLFVWPYYHHAARYDELRWSMRSVAMHYQGEADLLVVGDKPYWYDGDIIQMARKTSGTSFVSGLRDALFKFYTALERVDHNTIVWMMDDTFFLNSFDLHDLTPFRADSTIGRQASSGFARAKEQTKARLEREKMTTWDFATHLPHVVHREMCIDIFDYFDILNQLHLWEIIYSNATLQGVPEPTRPFFQYVSSAVNDSQMEMMAKKNTVINIQDKQWKEPVRRWLYDNLTEKPSFEIEDPVPPIRPKKGG